MKTNFLSVSCHFIQFLFSTHCLSTQHHLWIQSKSTPCQIITKDRKCVQIMTWRRWRHRIRDLCLLMSRLWTIRTQDASKKGEPLVICRPVVVAIRRNWYSQMKLTICLSFNLFVCLFLLRMGLRSFAR